MGVKVVTPGEIPKHLDGEYSKTGHLLSKKGSQNQILFISQKPNYRVLSFRDSEGQGQHLSRLFPTHERNVFSIDDGVYNYRLVESDNSIQIIKGRKKRGGRA